jgi:hypothetical protein
MPVITHEFRLANYYEAALWFVIAAMALGFAIKSPGHVRSRCLILGVSLIAFGFSDIYEATTGAWWRPLWLLVWKVACTAIMILLLVEHYRRRFRARRDVTR